MEIPICMMPFLAYVYDMLCEALDAVDIPDPGCQLAWLFLINHYSRSLQIVNHQILFLVGFNIVIVAK